MAYYVTEAHRESGSKEKEETMTVTVGGVHETQTYTHIHQRDCYKWSQQDKSR